MVTLCLRIRFRRLNAALEGPTSSFNFLSFERAEANSIYPFPFRTNGILLESIVEYIYIYMYILRRDRPLAKDRTKEINPCPAGVDI